MTIVKRKNGCEGEIMKYKKIIVMFCLTLVLALNVFAAETSEIEEGKALVEASADCADLNDDQREAIGEYIMEVMHPGEAHDAMHQMMGLEEGTEEHRLFHIGLADRMYCSSTTYSGYGMGMMYGTMMGNGYSYGMMKGYNYGMMSTWGFSSLLYFLLLLALLVLLIVLIIKLWRSMYEKKKK